MLIKHVIQIEFETFQVIRSVFVSTFHVTYCRCGVIRDVPKKI